MRDKITQIAISQIGVKEDPEGSNCVKFNTWFYDKVVKGKEYPWCGAFVSWVFNQAGCKLPVIDYSRGFAGTNYAMNNLHKWGVKVDQSNVLPGDVVFFDFDNNKRWDHTGIYLAKISSGMFQSIEGNTGIGNDSNGGMVMKRIRRYSSAVFVRPNVLDVIG